MESDCDCLMWRGRVFQTLGAETRKAREPNETKYTRGFAREGASNECGGDVNDDFRLIRSLYLPKLHINGHNYYIVLCSPLVGLHWRRNWWHWMTLYGHFALKSGPSSASNGLAFWLSEKTSEICRATHILLAQQKCSPATVLVISVMGLFFGVTRRGSVKPSVKQYFTLTVLTHAVHWCL